MRIGNAPDTLRLALARHPEYDEKFWRHLTGISAEERAAGAAAHGAVRPSGIAGGEAWRALPVVRLDSALWRVIPRVHGSAREVVVRYSFRVTPDSGRVRRAWRIFLRADGGLVGGMQSFLYPVGSENVPSTVRLRVPPGWDAATGLARGPEPMVFVASGADELLDSPILIGQLREWKFEAGGAQHRVVYISAPGAAPFDTAAFVGSIEGIVRVALAIFGRAPYREYDFLVQDGAEDALEHLNSLTIGVRGEELAHDLLSFAGRLAHEYFHTWNLVRIRPAETARLTYLPPAATPGLWWSEGVTLYYANQLLRRSGQIDSASMRRWLADRIISYFQNARNAHVSPEQASLEADAPAASDSGYRGSYYTQGMLFGQLLDILIRDSTRMRAGLDDVMRMLNDRFSRSKGFHPADLEQAVDDVSGCDMGDFFRRHIRGTAPVDINAFLRGIGMRAMISRAPAADSTGRPLPDLRVFAYLSGEGGGLRISLYETPNAWWRAGLRSGDEILRIDGRAISTPAEFRARIAQKKIGDQVNVDYRRGGVEGIVSFPLGGYERVHVDLEDIPGCTPAQKRERRLWAQGDL